jgi:hypothetical protein
MMVFSGRMIVFPGTGDGQLRALATTNRIEVHGFCGWWIKFTGGI